MTDGQCPHYQFKEWEAAYNLPRLYANRAGTENGSGMASVQGSSHGKCAERAVCLPGIELPCALLTHWFRLQIWQSTANCDCASLSSGLRSSENKEFLNLCFYVNGGKNYLLMSSADRNQQPGQISLWWVEVSPGQTY